MTELSTPLYAEHLAAGAAMTDFAGWQMPLRFTGDRAEHEAVRTRAGLFDLSHMAQFAVHGPQSVLALYAALFTALSRLRTWRPRYAMPVLSDVCILDHLLVDRLAVDDFLCIATAAKRDTE